MAPRGSSMPIMMVVQTGETQEQVVGWYAPAEVVDKTKLWKKVEATVKMGLVAVGPGRVA